MIAAAQKANGPAEVAASMPSLNTNNPYQENAVNEQHPTPVPDAVATRNAALGDEPKATDPLLALINEYLAFHHAANTAGTDDEADAIVQGEPMGRVFDRIVYDPPAPTTIAGAAAAVRFVHDESNGSYNDDLIRNVLAVVAEALEGRAA